jgi:hypothetical protein
MLNSRPSETGVFKINLFKSVVCFVVWLGFAVALFFYYYHTVTKQITDDLSSAYMQNGMKVITDLLDPGNLELLIAYQEKDGVFLNKRINAVYKLIDRVKFLAILGQEGHIITHRDFSMPGIRKKLYETKGKPRITIEMAWSRQYDWLMVIFSSNDSWQKLATIYLAIPSGIPNPLAAYLIQTTALGLLLTLLAIVRLKLFLKLMNNNTGNVFVSPFQKMNAAVKLLSKRKSNRKPLPVKTPLFFSEDRNEHGTLRVKAETLPTSFGNYTLIEKIGVGGMATLYKAYKNNRKSKFYAVKIPDYDRLPSNKQDEIHHLFRREVEISKNLLNQNIIYVYEAISLKRNKKALVMEYIDGRDLGQIISCLKQSNQKLPLNLLIYMATKICAGLEYCHSKNKIHRDIKPGNIMVSLGGSVKIGDFGIAKAVNYGNRDHTIVGTSSKGTPPFASPEQLDCKGADQISDIYSLGLTLYYIFAGKPIKEIDPVNADNRKIKKITPLMEIIPGTPSELNTIIMKCVHKKRGKRYQNAQELGEALVNLKFGLSIASDEIRLTSELSRLMCRLFS